MSSTTTNLGLTKPAYADEADIAVLNGNMDLLDAAYGNINQSTLRVVPFAVAVSDWSAVTGGFSATFNTAYVTTTSEEILTYDGSLIDYAKAHIIDAKKSGGGGIVFTTATKPTGTITGKAYVFDNEDHTIPTIIEGTVVPISNGGTGQSSLAGAQSALGITALSEQIASETGGVPTRKAGVFENNSSFQVAISNAYSSNADFAIVCLNISGNALAGCALLFLGKGTSKVKDLIGSMSASSYSTTYSNGTWTITNTSGSAMYYTIIASK